VNGHIHIYSLKSIVTRLRGATPMHPETRELLSEDMIWPLLREGATKVMRKTTAAACVFSAEQIREAEKQSNADKIHHFRQRIEALTVKASIYAL